MKRFLYLFAALALRAIAQAQPLADSAWLAKPNLTMSGYLEVYYAYDFSQPSGTARQPFLYNHNRHNEFNVNLGLVRLQLDHPKYRGSLALQTGTYANDNYAAEPGLLRALFEANVGMSLNRQNTLWLDAGVLPSHIGFESTNAFDNKTLTRSILAENSPYFETGAKLTYRPSAKLELAGLVLNGWQRIQRLEGNSLLSFGTQINYQAHESLRLNWSTFVGTNDPDSTRRMRYFNNLYGLFQVSERLGFIAGFDIGLQQKAKASSRYNLWYSPVLIGQYAFTTAWKMALRLEYYQDPGGVMIPTPLPSKWGFRTLGSSLTLDYAPSPNVICRLEGRWLRGKEAFFSSAEGPLKNNFTLGASLAVHFGERE
jgi:hypothetical protein